MDDAQLDMGLREDAVYRIREALKAVHAGYQDVLEVTVFQFRQHTQPELYAFVFGQPHASNSFGPSVLIPSARKTDFSLCKQWDTAHPAVGFATQ